jgi:uncharacterized protein (DUF58 family)
MAYRLVPSRARGAAPPRPRFHFLEPQALQRLRNLRLAARRIVEGTYAGRHRSRLRGSSVEFADYREYSPGDDLRRLDWKAFVRLGRPYLRTFDEETNLRCTFVLDTSESMNFGRPVTKLDYSRFLTAAMAYLVVQSRDQAGLALGADRVETYIEPQASFSHLDRLLSPLEKVKPCPRTNLAAVLNGLLPMMRRRAMLLVVSDFLDPSTREFFKAVRVFRYRHFEVILFHVIDPVERDLPQGAAFQFHDPESAGKIDASPEEIRREYRRRFDEFQEHIRQQAAACGCDYERLDTRVAYPEALLRYLRFRESVA